jgi:alpha-tubulin suppressor-like RCC1 family protein
VLGTGNDTVTNPVPVSIGSFGFVDLDTYDRHTCGITAASVVYCWGKNDYGRLGDGTLQDRWVPTAITSALND